MLLPSGYINEKKNFKDFFLKYIFSVRFDNLWKLILNFVYVSKNPKTQHVYMYIMYDFNFNKLTKILCFY